MATSPLNQFEIKKLIPLEIFGVDISFTNASLMMLLAVLATFALMYLPMRRAAALPSRWQNVGEILFELVANLVKDVAGPAGIKYLPFVFTMFMLVLMGNLLGMIPYGFTFTSHIAVTGIMGLMVISVVAVMGFYNHGWHFLSLFAPSGLPLPIYIILVPIEIISFLSRPFTLAVRLCANMTAGHTVLKVFALFSVSLGALFGIGPMIFNALMVGFELMVAVLQAYIFAILTCIYLKDAIDLH
jgi:F-type H+-transporting ATPase subunit a